MLDDFLSSIILTCRYRVRYIEMIHALTDIVGSDERTTLMHMVGLGKAGLKNEERKRCAL